MIRRTLLVLFALTAAALPARAYQLGTPLALLQPPPFVGNVNGSQIAGFPLPVVDVDCTKRLAYQNGLWGDPASFVAVSRASVAEQVDNSGAWSQVATNALQENNQGCNVWEGRTNSLLNSIGAGATIGTIYPTTYNQSNTTGIVPRITAVEQVSQGINFNSWLLSGTTATGTQNSIYPAQVAALQGQTWTFSLFYRLSAGSLANISTIQLGLIEYNSSGTALVTQQVVVANPTLSWQRVEFTRTLTNASTAFILPFLQIVANAAPVAINLQLDIAWPQLELNPATSSVASATVNSGGTLYTPSSSGTVTWSGAGCSVNPALNVTTSSGGVINAVTSVATAGTCTTFPSSSATTWSDGTGLGTGSGASFNLTPTNNASQGLATPPIVTSGSALARAADVLTLIVAPPVGAAYMLVGSGVPNAPTAYGNAQYSVTISDGTNNNRFAQFRGSSSGPIDVVITSGGATQSNASPGTVWTQSIFGKFASSIATNSNIAAFDGGAPSSVGSGITLPINPAQVNIGSRGDGLAYFNGALQRFQIFSAAAPQPSVLQSQTNAIFNLPYLLEDDLHRSPANDNGFVPAFLARAA
jgi:hypothetical protein